MPHSSSVVRRPSSHPPPYCYRRANGDHRVLVRTGRETAKNLLATGEYFVVGAVRDVDKMEAVAEIDGFNTDKLLE